MKNSKKVLKITDTTLRDAQQSVWAKHFKIDEIVPVLKKLDDCGFEALEVWGGGTFESALRFWKENPWDRLKIIKKNIKKTPLQMIIRGKNLVGYHIYSDEVIEEFIKRSIDCGISIVRVFDPINDIENIRNIIKIVKDNKAKVQGLICYTVNDEYNMDFFVQYAKDLKAAGVDAITIKDPAGLLKPEIGVELFKKVKKATNLEVNLHNHITNGIANVTCFELIKAGIDGIDCSMGPLSFPAGQPSIENVLEFFENDLDKFVINAEKVFDVSAILADLCFKKEIKKSYFPFNTQNLYETQLTRGSFSFLYDQLRQRNALDKLSVILKEIQDVRKDLGNPPMIIPISQLIIAQAIYNVLMGSRYKLIPREIKEYVKGAYGVPQGEISDEFKKLVKSEKNIVEHDEQDKKNKKTATKKFELVKADIDEEYIKDETDYLTYALFPSLAIEFFKYRNDPSISQEKAAKKDLAISTEEEIMVLNKIMSDKGVVEFELNQSDHYISVKKFSNETTNGDYTYMPSSNAGNITPSVQTKEKQEDTSAIGETIKTPIVGVFYSKSKPEADAYVKSGDVINEGDTVCIIEAMKVMNEIKAPFNCKIIKVLVNDKDSVVPNQDLFIVEKM